MPNFSVNVSNYASEGYTKISWSGVMQPNHYSFRVYRSDPETEYWNLIRERSDTANNFTYDDYSAPVGAVQYAVVEVVIVGEGQVEEAKKPRVVDLSSPYYWLIHPTDNSKNIQLRNITGDEFSEEREVEIKNLIDRGRKIDVGDSYGKIGSLTGKIYDRPGRTARQIRHDIESIKSTVVEYYLRNPFGDVWKIWFDDPKFSRIGGVGTSEFVEMSFNYYELG